MSSYQQKLPASGPEREALREKGQFWTPDWVAEAMIAYVLQGDSDSVFDPAVGAGVFLKAAKKIASYMGKAITLLGTELDPDTLTLAKRNGLTDSELSRIDITDFVLQPPLGTYKAIVANPPYIRHHRLSQEAKADLKAYGAKLIGKPLDGRAGLHVYFLLRALQLLDKNGRLAFIMPADTCEGVFAPTLWGWITRHYWLEAVVTFASDASPFPNVDTNPIIFMIRNATPKEYFYWARCTHLGSEELKAWILSGLARTNSDELDVAQRHVSEGLTTGLSRPPTLLEHEGPTLGHFAKVMRGIATGDNDFFLLTAHQAELLGIPDEFLIPAIARTRDVSGDTIDLDTLKALARKGRPTLLFSLDGRAVEQFPPRVREYLNFGEKKGLPAKALIASRRPWYKMEVRAVPPFLFAYLGRRNARFIRNLAEVVPLTGFLCVYPLLDSPDYVDLLWEVLRHPETTANLALVGKSYGGNAIKVEPRALEKLPLPALIVAEVGLTSPVKLLL